MICAFYSFDKIPLICYHNNVRGYIFEHHGICICKA